MCVRENFVVICRWKDFLFTCDMKYLFCEMEKTRKISFWIINYIDQKEWGLEQKTY